MREIRKKYLFSIFMCILVFLTVACKKEETATNQHEAQASLTTRLETIADNNSFTIESEQEEVTLQLKDTGWESPELKEVDAVSIETLISNLMSVQGTEIKKTKDIEKFFEQPDTIFNWTSEKAKHSVAFVSNEKGDWAKAIDEEVYYQVSSVTDDIKTFDFVYIQPSIKIGIDDPNRIEIHAEDQSVVLTTKTNMNAVEASPFISGWFLNGSYQTEFSVEYQKMEGFYHTLTNLKGTKAEELITEENASMILLLKNNKQEEKLFVKQLDEEKNYYMTVNSDQETYKVPAELIDQFIFDPLTITDNFIAILPLSAIQSIEIQQKDKTTQITAKHKLTSDDKDETTIQSTFYADEEELPETTFRKTYQYLASLSYDSVLSEDEKEFIKEEEEIKIMYGYLNNGKEEQETIRFIPIADSEYYVVEKNGVSEFKASKENVQTALDELEKVIN